MKDSEAFIYESNTLLINKFIKLKELHTNEFDLYDTNIQESVIEELDEYKNGTKNYEIIDETSKFLFNDFSRFSYDAVECLYANIQSVTEEMVVIDIEFTGIIKLWLNKQLIHIISKQRNRRQIIVKLIAGDNDLIFEYIKLKEPNNERGFIQLYSYSMVVNGKIMPKLKDQIEQQEINISSYYNIEDKVIEYMMLDQESKTYTGYYQYSNSKEKIPVQISSMKKYSIPIENDEIFGKVTLVFENTQKEVNLAYFMPEIEIDQLRQKAINYAEQQTQDQKKLMIYGLCDKITKRYLEKDKRYYFVELLQRLLDKENILTNRNYYRSRIDDSVVEIIIKKPKSYSKVKKYPLVFYLVDREECFFSDSVTGYDDYFFVDFYTGTSLGGGYVGEARMKEAFDYIMKEYSIDNSKIYLLGQSHTGYDAWSIVQNYPGTIAAAYIISGAPYLPNLLNVYNTQISFVGSNKDYSNGEILDSTEESLSYDKYTQIKLNNLIHDALVDFRFYPIMDFFENKVLNNYPKKVSFRTERNRYLNAFWIETYGIRKGKKSLSIQEEIKSNQLIEIYVNDANGFTIKLPPFLSKEHLTVSINGTSCAFTNIKENKLTFIFSESKYINQDFTNKIEYRKGTGVLDVYLDAIRQYIPDDSSEIVQKISENFASPLSNSVVKQINVHYPTEYLSQFVQEDKKRNYIFYNLNNLDRYFGEKIEIPINASETFFTYKGNFYYGDYCIMQVIAHPKDEKYSILLIQCNNDSLLAKGFFTRRVILPFMFNGLHSYYNNVAIILHDNKYYGIYEWDEDIRLI